MKIRVSAILFMFLTIAAYAQLDQDVPVSGTQVIAEDLVVNGSLAVGIDATSTESFGFDTFRLKENNLRIHFDDTSASASFPGNDWRISINDSGNGGLNYFAIEDATAGQTPFRVLAGAGNNALYVNASGNVGLGTASPVVELQVTDGDSPTIRIEQNGSNGWTPQTWDIAGNETNFFIRDVTNGSKLPFKIKPGAPDNALFIAASGDIALGNQSPSHKLDVDGSTDVRDDLYVGDQIGVGTTEPNANASLELTSVTQGVLINRLTTGERTTFTASLTAAENGMRIYDTDENITYVWNGTAWDGLTPNTDAQDADVFQLVDQTLSLSLDNNANESSVDLSPLLTDVEARLTALENAQSIGTGEVPELLNYQSVIRDASGAVLANQLVTFKMIVLQGSATGTPVYTELNQITTSSQGLASFQIGSGFGRIGNFDEIDWGADKYYLSVELNTDGGFTYEPMGTSQFVSVPYALRAKTADTVNNSIMTKQLENTEEELKVAKAQIEALKEENKMMKKQIETILKRMGD